MSAVWSSPVRYAECDQQGVVFNAQGQPVAGAVIAGGLALGTTDANGFFRITGVPAGSRTIEAGDPVNP